MGLRGCRGVERSGCGSRLCFATDTTLGIVTAFTAEDADGEVGVSLPSLLHWYRNVCPAFFPVQRLQLCSLSHLLMEIGGAAQAGKEEKQETGSLGPSAECHHAFCSVETTLCA